MKKMSFLVLSMLIVAIAPGANAAAPYVGLYGDTLGGGGGASHSQCAVYVAAPYTSIEMWIWSRPDAVKGMTAIEFKIAYPPSSMMIQGTAVSNPLTVVEMGSLGGGMSVALGGYACMRNWYWTHHQELIVKQLAPTVVQIVGHPDNGGHIYVASCESGYPLYDATVLNHLAINQSCEIGTKETSWGAIKNLYDK